MHGVAVAEVDDVVELEVEEEELEEELVLELRDDVDMDEELVVGFEVVGWEF